MCNCNKKYVETNIKTFVQERAYNPHAREILVDPKTKGITHSDILVSSFRKLCNTVSVSPSCLGPYHFLLLAERNNKVKSDVKKKKKKTSEFFSIKLNSPSLG